MPLRTTLRKLKGLQRLQELNQRTLIFVGQAWFFLKLARTEVVSTVNNQVGAFAE